MEKDVVVRILRILKGKGKIYVSKNQEVQPQDILGTAYVSPGFRTLNLANLLSVAPKDISKYMKKTLGQRIYKDELLAYRSPFLGAKKVVTAPADGVLDFLNPKTGDVRLTLLPKKEDLPSGVYGVVEFINNDKGEIIIRTQASLIHGVCGSGRIRDGILRTVSKRDELITKSLINPKYDGQILFGGSLIYKDSISAAISCGVNGIICGGINAQDYKSLAGGRLTFPKKLENDIGISLVVCEGFGSIPIGEDIYKLLVTFDGRYVLIDGNKNLINLPSFESKSLLRVRATSLGPIKSKTLLTTYEDWEQIYKLQTGARVRIIGNSYLGEQGIVIALDNIETKLPSGIKTFMATVETKRRKIQVPVANLEIIL